MVVGQTVPVPPPFAYKRDSEKYAGSAKISRTGGGDMTITGYVAGLPFPELRQNDPELVYKLMYDTYFHYHPAVLAYRQHSILLDTYLNRTDTVVNALEFRLNHVSDEGYPLNQPGAPDDVLLTSNLTVEAPEQSKYAVNLLIYYNDPAKIQDIYTYIPALRRSIRRSSAARCSPILGTDFVQDDLYARPVLLDQFSYHVLGYKKILHQSHLNQKYLFDEHSYNLTGVPGWPKPLLGTWELRTVWVLEERTLRSNSDYCYGDRVSYIDPDQFLVDDSEIYDRKLNLWKIIDSGYSPGPLDDGHGSVNGSSNVRVTMLDLINSHATVGVQVGAGQANGQVPEKFRDVQIWALPAGLAQVNQ
jgi:hypothetical protein